MSVHALSVSYSTSKGRETYGYNIVLLDDMTTGKRYRCMGGGYDMVGTVFAEWLQDVYADELKAIADRAASTYIGGKREENNHPDALYGMSVVYTAKMCSSRVGLDGACGLASMEHIASALGLSVRHTFSKRGNTTGFVVTSL